MKYAIRPPTAGETCDDRWNSDADENQRSHVRPPSRTTPSCTPLTSSTLKGHVLTRGKVQPGIARSSRKQNANTQKIVVSIEVSRRASDTGSVWPTGRRLNTGETEYPVAGVAVPGRDTARSRRLARPGASER